MNTYECYHEGCKKRYNSKYNLIRHINSYHLDNKSYMCSFCSKGFYNKQCLNLHMIQGICENLSLPKQGLGIIEDLSTVTQSQQYTIQATPPSSLPVLPMIERERQVPLHLAKLPIVSMIFGRCIDSR